MKQKKVRKFTAIGDSTANTDRLEAIKQLIYSCSAVASKEEFLTSLVQFMQKEFQCQCVGIRVLDEQGGIPYQAYTGFSQEFWEQENFVQISNGDCICTRLAAGKLLPCDLHLINEQGSYILPAFSQLDGLLSEADLGHYRGICVATGFQSAAMIPIVYQGEIMGLIHLADMRPNQIQADIVALIEGMVPLVAEVLSRNMMEKALLENQERQQILNNIVQVLPGLAYVIDAATWQLLYISVSMEQLYGKRVIGQSCFSFFGKSAPCHYCPLLENGSKEYFDKITGVYYKAESRQIEWPGRDSMQLLFVMDITEQKLAESALEEEKERYRVLLKQSAEAIVVSDFATKAVTEVNYAFSRLFGYTNDEALQETLFSLGILSEKEAKKMDVSLRSQGVWSRQNRRYYRRDGQLFYGEMRSSLITYLGKEFVLFSFRDLTERQRLQTELQEQVYLARLVQTSLLPPPFQDRRVAIRTIFQPLSLVSGDFYGYRWFHNQQILHGYLMDVTGHGIAAALHTSAINSLLNEIMDQEEAWTKASMHRLNNQLSTYFRDGNFAALMVFTFDFTKLKLSYISGGINYLLLSQRGQAELKKVPGIYFGLTDKAEFELHSMNFSSGDSFYFMTDGIYEHLPSEVIEGAADFAATTALLEKISSGAIEDDCSALAIHIMDSF
ncbi:MAG: SpoIIE family protein phosphatase [Sporomusaceae bacterium]|nr:SpoIIE family protein phosphatase [Sporomusaceae bacterium]